jgi:type VI protein secretion system component Hcp
MAIYAKFDNLKGDVKIKGYEDHSKILHCSYEITHPDPFKAGAGNSRRGSKVQFHPVTLLKPEDAASIGYVDAVHKGHIFKTVVLQFTLDNENGEAIPHQTITLSNVSIGSHQQEGHTDDNACYEVLQLHYNQFEQVCSSFGSDGKKTGQSVFGYDLATGKCL